MPPDAPLPDVREYRDIDYARHDEGELQLDLFVPAGRGPWPGVVVVHGGGWERGARQMENPFARHLAARGFAVATISYRLGPAGRFPNAPHDVESAARWMRSAGLELGIAPTPVGLVGASAGGALVAWVGARSPDGGRADAHPGAVVVIDGPVDFTAPAMVTKEADDPGAPTRFLGGSYAQRGDVWSEASALLHVGPHSAPTLFINSTSSTPILPGRAEMRAWLGALGIDAQTVVLPDTPHTFWLVRPWFDQVVDVTAQFLKRHLTASPVGGAEATRPAPAEPHNETSSKKSPGKTQKAKKNPRRSRRR